jgi:hypothetical protein
MIESIPTPQNPEKVAYDKVVNGLQKISDILESSGLAETDKKYAVTMMRRTIDTATSLFEKGFYTEVFEYNMNFLTAMNGLIGYLFRSDERKEALGDEKLDAIRRIVGETARAEEREELSLFIDNVS